MPQGSSTTKDPAGSFAYVECGYSRLRVNGGQRQVQGGQWDRSRMLDLALGQLQPSDFSSTWNTEMIIFHGC